MLKYDKKARRPSVEHMYILARFYLWCIERRLVGTSAHAGDARGVQGELRLAALQSEAGRELLQRVGRAPDDLSSIVLVRARGPARRHAKAVLTPDQAASGAHSSRRTAPG